MSSEEATRLRGQIPHGFVLCDSNANKWKIGSFINITGSTETYEAAPHHDKTSTEYPAIIKIEPCTNGPLSLDMQFYIMNANSKDIDDWIEANNLQKYGLGMPRLLGVGAHEHNAKEYCFIALERYSTNLWQSFLENDRKLSSATVYKVAFKTVRVLEYIHNRGYVHADIKGANIVRDLKKQHPIYLTNFALASKCSNVDSIIDPKNAHYGDMEYSSRDHHIGVSTKRGDIEMLLYNMIRWLCDNLPWDNHLNNPNVVHQLKENAFKYREKFLQDCFITSEVPITIKEFMALLASVNRYDEPNYTKFLTILKKGVALKKTNENAKTSQDSPAMANINKWNHQNPHVSTSLKHAHNASTSDDPNILSFKNKPKKQVGIRRSLRLQEKQQMKVNTTVTERKPKDDKRQRIVKRRKRKTKPAEDEDEELNEPNACNGGDVNSTRDCSPSQTEYSSCSGLNSSKLTNPPTTGCQSLPLTLLESKRFRSPVSQASSSGFNSFRSSQSGLLSEDLSQSHAKWHDTYEYLNIWLEMKDKSFEALGPISSEPQVVTCQVQKLRVFRDEFRMQQPQIDTLVEVLRKLPLDSEGAQKLDGIMHCWRTQLGRLEEQGQKLSDACFYQLDSVLQKISDDLKNHSLDKEMEEQLLPKLKTYASQLESHQTLLANARIMAEQLSRVFGDSTLGSRVRAKFSSVNKLYHDLQEEIDSRKAEVKKSLGDGDQLYEKCEEILAWLEKELADIPENLLISADRKKLQEQFKNHEAIYQRISSKEAEVKELLNKGGNVFTKLSNLDDRNLGKRYLNLIQSQWSLLKMRGLKILEKLQNCVNCRKKYDNAQNQFLPWLSRAMDRLENFNKSALLKSKENILKQQMKLSSFSYEVNQKSGEFEQNMELGHTYVSFCDKDKEYVIKEELLPMEYQWKRLKNQLSECTESLEDVYSFNASLSDLKRKLELCEHELMSLDGVEKRTEDAKRVLNRIKKLQGETASLQEPLDDVRQQSSDLVPKVRKQGIDVNHLLGEMDRITDRITALKGQLAENYNEFIRILEQKAVHVKRELQETRQVGRNIMRQKIKIKSENVSQELIDLVSDEEGE